MFPKFSVRRPYTIIVAIVLVLALGVVTLTRMKTSLIPDMNLPYAIVLAVDPGASPEEVELQVTTPIEESLSTLSNLKMLSSRSMDNISMVTMEFTDTTNMDSALIEIREKLSMAQNSLPDSVASPTILKINPNMMPVMALSVSYTDTEDLGEISQRITNDILPQLQSVEGVASATGAGLIERAVHVVISDEKINALTKQITDAMTAQMQQQMQQAAEALTQQMVASGDAVLQADGTLVGRDGQPIDIMKLVQEQMSGDQEGQTGDQAGEQTLDLKSQLSRDTIVKLLQANNFNMPNGTIADGDKSYLVRTGDKMTSYEQVRDMPLMKIGDMDIKLSDVADVALTDNSKDTFAMVNGSRSVMMTLQAASEYSTSEVTHAVHDRIAELKADDPNLKVDVLMDQGEYVDIVVDSVLSNLLIGGLLAILILFIFLHDFKLTIVIALSIPLSVMVALVGMYFSGVSMNIISMSGLALGVGMLVDNSVVVIENIYRMRNEGLPARKAAVHGAKQVTGAIFASTLTTIGVFAPIIFVQGITRQLFADMALTIAYSLLASLLVSLTFVPMITSGALRNQKEKKHAILDATQRGYAKAMRWVLKHKLITVCIPLVLLIVTGLFVVKQGASFMPTMESPQMNITLEMPDGATFEEATATAEEAMKRIGTIENVETVGGTMGGQMAMMGSMVGISGRGGSYDQFTVYVLLDDTKNIDNDFIGKEIERLTADLDCEVQVTSESDQMSMLTGPPVNVRITGIEIDQMRKISDDVTALMTQNADLTEIQSGFEEGEGTPELRIMVDKQKSMAVGLSVAQVYMQVAELMSTDEDATTIIENGEALLVSVADRAATDVGKSDIEKLKLTSPTGGTVALTDVATISEAPGVGTINHERSSRVSYVQAKPVEGKNVKLVNDELAKQLDEYRKTLPAGYTLTLEGENAAINSTFDDLFLLMALAVLIIFCIMVAQFQSFKAPFIVLFTIPLAFTGAFAALLLFGMEISVVAMVGLVLLAGVVVNNGIVLVDYINILRHSGMSKEDAIIQAGQTRMRPILITALTTIIAMSTMMFGMGTGTAMVQPMAITSVGGLLYATLMTLFIVPAIYAGFFRKEKLKTFDIEEVDEEIKNLVDDHV